MFLKNKESPTEKHSVYMKIKSNNIYIYNAFDIRDKLKILQFRWEPSDKSWFITENVIRTAISQILYEDKEDYTGEITLPLILKCCEEREKYLNIDKIPKSSKLQSHLNFSSSLVSPLPKPISSSSILSSLLKDINIVMKSDCVYLYNSFSLKEFLKKLNFRFDKDEKAWYIPILNIRQIISDKLYSGSWYKDEITLEQVLQCIVKDMDNNIVINPSVSDACSFNPNLSVSVIQSVPVIPSPPPSPNRLRVSNYNTYLKQNMFNKQRDIHEDSDEQKWKFGPQSGLKKTKSYSNLNNLNWSWGPQKSNSPSSVKNKRSFTDAFGWSCPACVFLNESSNTTCEMCGTESPFEEEQISLFSSLDTLEDDNDSPLPFSISVLRTSQDSGNDHFTSVNEQSSDQSYSDFK